MKEGGDEVNYNGLVYYRYASSALVLLYSLPVPFSNPTIHDSIPEPKYSAARMTSACTAGTKTWNWNGKQNSTLPYTQSQVTSKSNSKTTAWNASLCAPLLVYCMY